MNIFLYDWLYLEAKDQNCDFSEIKAPLYKWYKFLKALGTQLIFACHPTKGSMQDL